MNRYTFGLSAWILTRDFSSACRIEIQKLQEKFSELQGVFGHEKIFCRWIDGGAVFASWFWTACRFEPRANQSACPSRLNPCRLRRREDCRRAKDFHGVAIGTASLRFVRRRIFWAIWRAILIRADFSRARHNSELSTQMTGYLSEYSRQKYSENYNRFNLGHSEGILGTIARFRGFTIFYT